MTARLPYRLNARHHRPHAMRGLLAGLAGGVAGTAVMTALQYAMQAASDDSSGGGEGGESATARVADAAARSTVGHELHGRSQTVGSQAVHWGFGAAMGALYGLAAEYVPAATAGYGTAFGAALFVGADETAVPALGLSQPPTQQPISTHAYGLAAHAVYGVVVEAVRSGVREMLE